MKKYILFVVLALTTIGLNAQKNKKYIQTRDCFVSTFAEAYSLDEVEQASLTEAFNKKSTTGNKLKKEMTAGTITKAERQTKMKELNAEYFNLLKTITGKSLKDVKAFDKEIRAKCTKK